jgi:hypothetical protein
LNNNKSAPKFQNQKNILEGIKRKAAFDDKIPKKRCKQTSALKCMALLPGIPGISDFYSGASSSESDKFDSSDSSEDDEEPRVGRDFIGRKIKTKSCNEGEH